MKAAKKQNNANTKKSQVNEKSLGPEIDKFFKSAPKTFVFENVAVAKSKDGAKEIFADILKEKLRGKNHFFHVEDYLLVYFVFIILCRSKNM